MKTGIPTEYKGYLLRSRLEAKWAHFFDLLGWRWVYEPTDFDGWIPDFALLGAKQTTYVEVKPVARCDEPEFRDAQLKIEMSGCPDEVLLVGLQPFYGPEMDALSIGWLRQSVPVHVEDEDGNVEVSMHVWDWGEAAFGQWRNSSTVGFCHAVQTFNDRISGEYDGGSYGEASFSERGILELWAKATNAAQWNPPPRKHTRSAEDMEGPTVGDRIHEVLNVYGELTVMEIAVQANLSTLRVRDVLRRTNGHRFEEHDRKWRIIR